MTIKCSFRTSKKNEGKKFNAIIYCLTLFFLLAPLQISFAQDAKVSVTLNNAHIKQFFSSIEQQTNYHFSYRDADIVNKEQVTISAKSQTVASLLNKVLPSRQLQYSLNGNKIIVTSLKQVTPDSGRKVKITGVVKDNAGEPLIGVTVLVAGHKEIGTITDVEGKFSLANVPANTPLQFSYVGYETMKMLPKDNMNVVLAEDSKTLDEVVVVGYGVQKKANLSGAVATLDTKQIENRPVLNVGQALQGTVANLNVSVGSGQAISNPSFNIRGTNSINGGSPLIIIDGAASDSGTLNRMNPNDIASMSVLKDAASCAIYGAKAAYGVILVTTKQGRSEKLQINYNNNFSLTQNTRMNEFVTDPYTVATVRNKMYIPWGTIYNDKELEYAKKVSNGEAEPFYVNEDGYYKYFGQTDWVNECFKNSSFATNHSVDFSGSTDKVDYYFSAGYNYQNGMIKYNTDTYNRYNLNSKLNFKITKNFSIYNNSSVMSYDYKAPSRLDSGLWWEINRVSPMDVPKNPDGTWTSEGASKLGRLAEGGDWKKYETKIRTQFGTRFDFIKDILFVQGSITYSTNKYRENWYYSPVTYSKGPEKPMETWEPTTSATTKSGDDKDIYIDVYATFHKVFNKKHDFTAMVGFNQNEYSYYNSNHDRKDLISISVPITGLATGDMNVGEGLGSKATRSGFGRLGYVYNGKYILELNGRYDGTSSFPHDDRFVFSPSFSAGWVISSEKFFESLKDVVSFFKVRGSYGRLGNQDVGYYPYLPTMGNGKLGAIIDGEQPVYVSTPGLVSGSLTWEKVSTMNVGADANFFNNRLSLSGEYYVRRTKDMLTAGKTLPGVLGTGVPLANAADLKTRGWELTVGYKDQFRVAGKPLNFSANFNISDSRSFITKFDNPNGNLSDYYVGYEMGQMWGLTTLGFFHSQEERDNWANQDPVTCYPGSPKTGAGDLRFADLDDDGIVNGGEWTLKDHGDYRIIGNSRSRYQYGLQLNADWNGFDLGVFLQGVGKKNYYPGGDIYFWGCFYDPWSNFNEGHLNDHWTEDNPNAYFPRMKSYMAYGNEGSVIQTRYMQNAAYLRLKNLQVGYTLPKSIVEKVGLSHVRLFFTGDNLAVWSGLYKHYKIDPETLGGNSYPLQRAYSFGMNVSF